MLRLLSVNNFVLIDDLKVGFDPGFSIITGETGAGKSILLGALSLLQGGKADGSTLLDATKKCVVEGAFDIANYNLSAFFEQNDLEYDDHTIIRREISENGRSRAFVNDIPVSLVVLKELTERLIDIHSQHQNLKLNDGSFQLGIVDAIANTSNLLIEFGVDYKEYKKLQAELKDLIDTIARSNAEADLWQHQFTLLEEAKIKPGELQVVEEECNTLSNAEEIKIHLTAIEQQLTADGQGVLPVLKDVLISIAKLKSLTSRAESLFPRVDSCLIELKDIQSETSRINDSVELDPDKLAACRLRLDTLYGLMQRFKVGEFDELITIREQLRERLNQVSNADEVLSEKKKQVENASKLLLKKAEAISAKRKAVVASTEKAVMDILHELGMPNALFTIQIQQLDQVSSTGIDDVKFLFAANRSGIPQEIGKVASGGEISRLMLAIKAIVAKSLKLPTIVFDEIDSGISGEVAGKLAKIIREMSANIQVIDITHLPQVAARGHQHYLVYKNDDGSKVRTGIRLLNQEERIEYIARMLSGMQVTQAAFEHAKQLLNE